MAVAIVAAGIAGAVSGAHAAISALLGGGIAVFSGYMYVWRAWRRSAATGNAHADAKSVFRAQAAGESMKFAVTVT